MNLGATENEAKTKVKSSGVMPTADDVGPDGLEGAAKTVASMVDALAPITHSKRKGGPRHDSDDDGENKRRRKPEANGTDKKAMASCLPKRMCFVWSLPFQEVTPEQQAKKDLDKDLKGYASQLLSRFAGNLVVWLCFQLRLHNLASRARNAGADLHELSGNKAPAAYL